MKVICMRAVLNVDVDAAVDIGFDAADWTIQRRHSEFPAHVLPHSAEGGPLAQVARWVGDVPSDWHKIRLEVGMQIRT